MSNAIKVIAGLDVGNGYVKGSASVLNKNEKVKSINIDIPSGVAAVACPIEMPPASIEAEVNDIFDRASLSFNSPNIKNGSIFSTTRAYLGRRAIESAQPIIAFNINNRQSKAEQDLSSVLVLSLAASAALQGYYEANKSLPDSTLQVECVAGLALPIDEYRKFRETFADGFMKNKHLVSFHNFESPVNVEIKFTNVKVIAEGASAIFAIKFKGEEFVNAMLNEVRQKGVKLEGITASDIINSEGVLGIDIGEGTVNFPVFTSGKFNTDYSGTLPEGYGTILESSLEPLRNQNNSFQNRKTLAEFLQKKPSALSKNRYDATKAVIDAQSIAFCYAVVEKFTELLRRADGQVEVIYVYGGGANPLKQWLYPRLIEASKDFSANGDFALLFLDSRYSRLLNREGLYKVAEGEASGG